mmetsp:Transcript_151/g.457  ORF Transcript_151/g.457 Transcript_151/m.457 type:complete len:403 (-) Transcript_151:27-1235(-)
MQNERRLLSRMTGSYGRAGSVVLLALAALAWRGCKVHALEPAPVPVCLLHMHDGASFFREYGTIALRNKERYAARHGYELAVHTPSQTYGLLKEADCSVDGAKKRHDGKCYVDNNVGYKNDRRAATFGKIKLAQAACVGRENYWLLWTDADALVVNQTIKLEDHIIDDRYDFILTKDWLMLNAGMLLMKCSDWTKTFLRKVYDAEEYNRARALDQSSFQDHMDKMGADVKKHVKFVPKWAMNVYTEEYRPGDFLLHMAGKLHEATPAGAVALIRQFDTLSLAEDIRDVEAFFDTPYMLNMYSGTCAVGEGGQDCPPEDKRRVKLPEPLGAMSSPDRYRHVRERYYWLKDWKDEYDVPDWNSGRVSPLPLTTYSTSSASCAAENSCDSTRQDSNSSDDAKEDL